MKDLGGGVLNQKEARKDGKNQQRPPLRAAQSGRSILRTRHVDFGATHRL
jgi:hypothetical protein